MNRAKLRALLELNEGRRNKVYKDSLGYDTIGIGHLMSRPISDAAVDQIFADDLAEHEAELRELCPWIDEHDEVRQAALIDLCFNLGRTKLAQFKNTLGAFRVKAYEAAALGLEQSRWFTQVGKRGPRIVKMVRTGAWPAELG